MMALLHPMKSRILAGATMVLALGLGSGVQGTVISTNQADFAYEGNDVPAGGGWSGFTDTMSTTPEYTIVDDTAGGVWTRSVTLSSAPTGGTQFFQAYKAGAMNDLTFTLDWRVARPLIQGTAGFQQDGPQLDVLVDLDGPGGSDDARRLVFSIGDSYYGGVGWDLTVTDMITHFDGDGTGTTEGIAGLNISNFNVFRVVGLGDGSYKIYMNDVVAPIRTGNLAAAADAPGTAGRLNTAMQAGFPGGGPVELEMQTDYIRLLNGTALDEAPLIEPIITFTNVTVDNVMGMDFESSVGLTYRLDATPDLVSSNFQSTGGFLEGSGGTLTFFDPTGPSTNKMYQIKAIAP